MTRLAAGAGRRAVMGVVNVTPDSFSDGGYWFEPAAAIAHGRALAAEGADLVDIGGESTRPGAERPSVEEELRRVLPVVEALSDEGVMVSVDTMRAEVAAHGPRRRRDARQRRQRRPGRSRHGSAGRRARLPYVAMHWRGHSTQMQSRAVYDDVVAEVCAELADRRDALLAAGRRRGAARPRSRARVRQARTHNWALLAHLPSCTCSGQPVLVGASRKTFLGRMGRGDGRVAPAGRRPGRRDRGDLRHGGDGRACGAYGCMT